MYVYVTLVCMCMCCPRRGCTGRLLLFFSPTRLGWLRWYSVHLLYWNKSANTDAAVGEGCRSCFTGIKVQILTQLFGGAQILYIVRCGYHTKVALLVQKCLLYWYKSTSLLVQKY